MPIIVQTTTGAQTVFTIGDLANETVIKCENRVSDIGRAYVWVRDTILELAGNPDYRHDFEELAEWGIPFNLTPKIQEYEFQGILPIGDLNLGTLDILIWTDYPTNTNRRRLERTSFQDTDQGSASNYSLPNSWYRFGSNFGLYPVPDKPYQIQARVLKRHPMNDQALATTPVLLPREWNEIIEWAAAMRGFMELEMFDKAGEIRTLLHGDPKHPDKPGLLNSIKKVQEREDWRSTKSLQPIVGRYTNASRR